MGIENFIDGLEEIPDLLGIKDFDPHWEVDFADISTIVDADAGPSLSDYLKSGNISGLVDDVYKTDWEEQVFITSAKVTFPVPGLNGPLSGSVVLSAENISLQGPRRYRLGQMLNAAYSRNGRTLSVFLGPEVTFVPEDPTDPFGPGTPSYGLGFGAQVLDDF